MHDAPLASVHESRTRFLASTPREGGEAAWEGGIDGPLGVGDAARGEGVHIPRQGPDL
jgi:hypothetical protein